MAGFKLLEKKRKKEKEMTSKKKRREQLSFDWGMSLVCGLNCEAGARKENVVEYVLESGECPTHCPGECWRVSWIGP